MTLEHPFSPPADSMRPDELRMYRIVLLVGGALNMVFWAMHQFLSPPGTDPMWQRLILSTTCLAVAGGTWWSAWLRTNLLWPVYAIFYAGTIWWIHRVAASGLRPEFAVGLLIVPAIVSLGFHRASHHLSYAFVTMADCLVEFLGVRAPGVNPAHVLLCVATLLGLMHVLIRTRLRAYDELLASEDLRQVLIDQTTDALVLVDPILREAVECNGRARTMFEVPPGGEIRELAAEAFGAGEFRTTDIVAVMKEISDHGTFTRERHYVTASGRRFDGDLAISAVRLGRRRVWLMRVADESDRHHHSLGAPDA